VWARLAIVALLGGALLWWPYGHGCGLGLYLYLAATAMVVIGGVWVAACTWTCRMAWTHLAAIVVALWGAGLIGSEILPRIGYASTTASWSCVGV
jgi:hypothetical protein